MGENERCVGDVADFARAGGDVEEGAPSARQEASRQMAACLPAPGVLPAYVSMPHLPAPSEATPIAAEDEKLSDLFRVRSP